MQVVPSSSMSLEHAYNETTSITRPSLNEFSNQHRLATQFKLHNELINSPDQLVLINLAFSSRIV